MKTRSKIIVGSILTLLLFTSVMALVYFQNVSLPQFAVTTATCTGFNDIALSGPVDYVSNDPKLQGKAWLLTVVQNCMGRHAVGIIDADSIADAGDDAKAEYDLKIETSVDEQKCNYNIKVDGIPVKHMNHETVELWYNPLIGEAGCKDWFTENCYNRDGYFIASGKHPFGVKTWCTCFFTTGTTPHGILETPKLDFKSTIKLTAKGESYEKTISSTGPGSVTFDNNIAYVYWNGNLVSGEQCPIASDYRVSAAYVNGYWKTIDENYYQQYLGYHQSGMENCIDRYVEYGSETPDTCTNSYNTHESNALAGKSLYSTGGSKAVTYGQVINGRAELTLSKIIQYPLLSMKVNADWLGVFIPVGQPKITFVQSLPFTTGTSGVIDVELKNVGNGLGSFDVYADCPAPFSKPGSQTIQLYPQETGRISLIITAGVAKETTGQCTVHAYDKNNPENKDSKTVTVTAKPIITCTVGDTRCNGNYIERCTDGTKWDQIQLCDYGCEIKEGKAACKEQTKKCNYNGICEPNLGETIASCPTDCYVVDGDGDGEELMKYLPYIVVILVLVLAGVVIYKRKGKGRKKYYR